MEKGWKISGNIVENLKNPYSEKSIYPDDLKARAIELSRLVDNSRIRSSTVLTKLAEEFPDNKRLRNGSLSYKVVRAWRNKRPNMPEEMRALGFLKNLIPVPLAVISKQDTIEEIIHEIFHQATAGAIQAVMPGTSIQAIEGWEVINIDEQEKS